jgi:hypothetical protein
MRLICILALTLAASIARAQTTINAVYFGQTHVLKATDPYFGMVGTLTETYGTSFTISGAGWSEAANVWTKTRWTMTSHSLHQLRQPPTG